MRLAEQTIVVTGGSAGLGRAMADAFVRDGANVVISGRTPDTLDEAVADFDGPGQALGVRADVRSFDDVRRLVERTEEAYGPVDTLVNNAGTSDPLVRGSSGDVPVADLELEVWDTVVDTNLRGPFLCAKAVLPGMLERDAGRLVHVSSGMGRSARAGRAAYVSSKFGLEGLAETLALELDGTGVESMTLRPPGGGVYTESRGAIGRERERMAHEPSVMGEASVRLVAGAGENGGRYVVSEDGEGFETYG